MVCQLSKQVKENLRQVDLNLYLEAVESLLMVSIQIKCSAPSRAASIRHQANLVHCALRNEVVAMN